MQPERFRIEITDAAVADLRDRSGAHALAR